MFSLLIAARKMSLDAKFIGGEGVDGGQGDGDYMYGKFCMRIFFVARPGVKYCPAWMMNGT